MLCRRTARLQVRCAPVGDVGAVSRALWLAAEPHRYGGALCALIHTGAGSRRCRIATDVRCAP